MNLVIDIGNTLVKYAVFDANGKIVHHITSNDIDPQVLDQLMTDYEITSGIYSSVKNTSDETLKKYNFLSFTTTTPVPLTHYYKTPKTLGLDRIAAVVGAKKEFPKTNVLVIDMGTCITYDIINAKEEYLGGAISPGFRMRFKALNQFTGKLPLFSFSKEKLALVGDTTEKSIISGVYFGVQKEIEGIVDAYLAQYNKLKIVVTGGDAGRFDLGLKNRIFADKFIVLKGLNEILRYNEKK